jgi:DNA-binding transcriptional regulator LsrR (DeoR family)
MSQTGRSPGRRADPELIGKSARLHYEFGLTHREISEMLGISRVKVTRLLAQARDMGMVQITVNSDASPYVTLETQLVQRFGLDEAVVVPTFADALRQRGAVARGGAGYLQRVLRDGMTITIGLSSTLARVPDYIVAPTRVDATFVPLSGGLSRTRQAVNAHESTERLAQLFGGRAEHLHAPVVMGSRELAEALRREPAIARALHQAASADLALVGIGSMQPATMNLLAAGDITHAQLAELRAAGAVGDIGGRFFDSLGRQVVHELNDRLIGLTLDEIEGIGARVAAAAGDEKDAALLAALRATLVTVLITDAGMAQRLLDS